jgi:hypothetical protein
MDRRCPRKLKEQPDSWCPLAVLRLKALRNAGRELTEEEERKLPGCPWAVNHQMANYCFFNYMSQFLDENSLPSETEVAHLLNVSQETVKKTQKSALDNIRNIDEFKQIKETYGTDPVVGESSSDEDPYTIIK